MLSISISVLLITIGVNAKPPHRIIGGQDTQDGDYPWQVSLQIHDQHICGGSIISSKHILTAARCVVNVLEDLEKDLLIITGTKDLFDGHGHEYGVEKIILHENYQPEPHFLNDIALITINGTISFDNSQRAISLPNYNTPGNFRGEVTGWGVATPDGYHLPNLQSVMMSTLDNESCEKVYGIEVDDNQICAIKKEGTGICQGDIGGPFASENTLIGITSHSVGACADKFPDIFTRVYNYVDWIQKTSKNSHQFNN